jgi:hypothetical protein
MTPPTDASWDGAADAPERSVESIEAYEDDGRVVLFDAENPLAWVEASWAVTLADRA